MNLKEQLKEAIAYCNLKLLKKGVTDYATSVVDIGNKIESINVVNLTKFITTLYRTFYDSDFIDNENIVLEYGEKFNGDMQAAFAYSKNIKSIKFIGPLNNNVNLGTSFLSSSVQLIDFSECEWKLKGSLNSSFASCNGLISITGILDCSEITGFNSTFNGCYSLQHLNFKESSIKKSVNLVYSSKLSEDTRQSIFDGLADLTGQDSQVLTLNKTLEEKITDEQKAYVVSKNWQLAFA